MRSSVLSRLLPRQRLLRGWLYHYPRLLCAALSTTPLACARWLRAPAAVAQQRGDLEHADWWERHRDTLEAAWRQYGRSDERVYRLPTLGRGLHPACPLLGAGSLASLEQPAPGVYAFPLFTPAFCEALLDEVCRCTLAQTFGPFFCLAVATPVRTQALAPLSRQFDHLAAAGIPMRRPNGMNRFGMILSELGFGGLLRELSERLVAPLGVQLFPEWVAARSSRSTVPRLSRTAAKILPAWNV
jgi:hypothetical protein